MRSKEWHGVMLSTSGCLTQKTTIFMQHRLLIECILSCGDSGWTYVYTDSEVLGYESSTLLRVWINRSPLECGRHDQVVWEPTKL
ncbi:hypothetical protein BDR04DRAFT_1100321 [Suillus decipiens]|nr:hypothetical protein BDR04DRAFT_1100321 [Suillus decipiens]